MAEQFLPRITILATGGTIAGQAQRPEQLTGYLPGAIGIGELVADLPQLAAVAGISCETIAAIDSKDMTAAIWLRLARRCNELLATAAADGIVITHGTDTMEETAYFLNLTVHSARPVVLTGAMRPATALSADGPLNLLNAVRVAAAPAAWGKGVLLAMNDGIYAAREAVKSHTLNVAAFTAAPGPLGCIAGGKVYLEHAPLRRHTVESAFDVSNIASLPRVEIIYGHCDDDGALVTAARRAGAAGIVYVGSGMGSVPLSVLPALRRAAQAGVPVVSCSRTSSGMVLADASEDRGAGFIAAGNLPPCKARILLQLALLTTAAPAALQRIFDEY